MYPQSNSLYFGIYFITPICELENEWSLEKIRSIIYFIQAFFHEGLKGGAVWGPISEKIFCSLNWLIFGIWGFSGMRNRLAQVPSSKKIFVTPYRGVPHVKNQFFQLFYFDSKSADFWYSGVFGHEKSIGANPEFRKKFYDPLNFWVKIRFLRKNGVKIKNLKKLIF